MCLLRYYPKIYISRLHPLLVAGLLYYYSAIKGYYPYPENLQTEENYILKKLWFKYICKQQLQMCNNLKTDVSKNIVI